MPRSECPSSSFAPSPLCARIFFMRCWGRGLARRRRAAKVEEGEEGGQKNRTTNGRGWTRIKRGVGRFIQVLLFPARFGSGPVRPTTAAAFGRALAVGRQDRISCGWSGQWRSRIGSLLMTNAPLLIWINPKPIKKGESRLSLFDLCGSTLNMPVTKPLLPRSKRIPSRRIGSASASKPSIRLFNLSSGRTHASNQCSVGAAWLHWLKA